MAMLMAGALQRPDRGCETPLWSCGSGQDGLIRLALALLLIAGVVLTLEMRGLRWLWPALSGLFGGGPT
jgi:hypothetical protein